VPAFWLLDAMIDVYLFGESESFHHSLFGLEPMELYMRLLISVLFIGFGLYAAFLLNRAERLENHLRESNRQLVLLKELLEQQVAIDPLTNIFNRRKFHDSLATAISNAGRYFHQFALLMIDIDHFKHINDTFGHQAGDEVLRDISKLIHASVRNADMLFRVGGEEFTLLAMVSEKDDVWLLAEKLRQIVASHSFDRIGKITVSIGIAYFREGDTQESIYSRADEAMYQAKRGGRNCVVSSPRDIPETPGSRDGRQTGQHVNSFDELAAGNTSRAE